MSHRTCLLAFSEVKNLQNGLDDDTDKMEELEASPVTKRHTCCRALLQGALTMSCCRRGLFLLPPSDLCTGGAEVREAERIDAGEGKNATPPLSVESYARVSGNAMTPRKGRRGVP